MKDPAQKHLSDLRFISAIKRAKAEDVDVIGILGEVLDQERLSKTRNFLLRVAGLWCFVGPVLVVWAQVYIAQQHVEGVKVPDSMVHWTCAMGFVSILAFGFDLVNPQTLRKIGLRKGPEPGTTEIEMSKSGIHATYITNGDEPQDEF